jgi:hypothetical protein
MTRLLARMTVRGRKRCDSQICDIFQWLTLNLAWVGHRQFPIKAPGGPQRSISFPLLGSRFLARSTFTNNPRVGRSHRSRLQYVDFLNNDARKYWRSRTVTVVPKATPFFFCCKVQSGHLSLMLITPPVLCFRDSSKVMLPRCGPLFGDRTRRDQLESCDFTYPGCITVHMNKPPTKHERVVVFPPTCLSHLIRRLQVGSSFCAGFEQKVHAIETVPRHRRMGVYATRLCPLPPTIHTRIYVFFLSFATNQAL